MSKPAGQFALKVEHIDNFQFKVTFDKPQFAPLLTDEPAPLGSDEQPNPARILAAAIGTCLSASLVFCLQRARIPVADLTSDLNVELVRNDRNRLRVGKIDVTLRPEVGADPATTAACLEAFEDFCVVTQSVREGIEIAVRVDPQAAQ
jgi:uncharacterized OsmC-like protein